MVTFYNEEDEEDEEQETCKHVWKQKTIVTERCVIVIYTCQKCFEHYEEEDCGDGPEPRL